MSFEETLQKAINEIEVPEELSPASIEAMLRASGIVPDTKTDMSDDISRVGTISAVHVTHTKRALIMRTLAAAAACAALAAGLKAFRQESIQSTEPIDSRIEYKDGVQSYDELYNIYTSIYLKNSEAVGAENGDGKEIITDDPAVTEEAVESAVQTEKQPEETRSDVTEAAAPVQTEQQPQETGAVQAKAERSDLSDADIVKSDENSIYYISGNTLYAVDKDDMTIAAEIVCENVPFEMYVKGNTLVLISEEISGGENNVAADIYDISSGIPEHRITYKQNGQYTSARLDSSGVLYLVTGYSDYRKQPLDENAKPESYVPGYYINGEKHYVAAEDVSVPKDANNTDYTVVSSVHCGESADPGSCVSVKAVLGSSANAYCSESTLYVAGTGVKDGREYTAVTSFALHESGLEYKASAVIDGELISRYSMAETDGLFRIACRSFDENGMTVTDIYSLDSYLNAVKTSEGLLPGVIIGSVKFEGNYASLIEKGHEEPSLVVDLNEAEAAESKVPDPTEFYAAYVNKFSDDELLGIGRVKGDDGENASLRLEMYNADGVKTDEISFADILGVDSPALSDRKAMLADHDLNIIGIPVSGNSDFGMLNQYYVFGYDPEEGFFQKGVIQFNDISDGYKFERAVINDDVLIIIGSGRMVSVRISDMAVIDIVDF